MGRSKFSKIDPYTNYKCTECREIFKPMEEKRTPFFLKANECPNCGANKDCLEPIDDDE